MSANGYSKTQISHNNQLTKIDISASGAATILLRAGWIEDFPNK